MIGASVGASDSSHGDSSDEVENYWQRSQLKGSTEFDSAEKLGELLSGLHILLVAKIMRKVHNKKEFRWIFQVKGLLLDKSAVTVLCIFSVDLTSSGAQLSVALSDYMGTLDSTSLCYLVRALTSS